MMENSEKAPNVLKCVEEKPGAYPEGSGWLGTKNEKMPDPSSQAERRGEGKNVISEEENPLPGRKLPPRSTIKKRPTPQTPCPDQTRGPEPSPGGQGWVDPKNPMGKSANHPEPRDPPEGNTPVHPPDTRAILASNDPLAPPPGGGERVGNSGEGERRSWRIPDGESADLRDPSARAAARAEGTGKTCVMVRRGVAPQNLGATEVTDQTDRKKYIRNFLQP